MATNCPARMFMHCRRKQAILNSHGRRALRCATNLIRATSTFRRRDSRMNIVGFLIIGLLLQQPRLGSIEGVVAQMGNAQPIARAVVELSGGNQGQQPIAMATAADGKFEFRNLPAGRYRLTVSRNGYLDSAYGKRGPNGTATPLTLEAGQTLKEIRLT